MSVLARTPVVARIAVLVVLIALGAVLVVVTTGANGEENAEQPAATVVRGTLDGQPVRVTVPAGDQAPRGLAIYFHGQGGTVNDKMDGDWIGALVDDGWAVASSAFHGQAWGNSDSTDDTTRLIDWAEEQSGATTTMWISGSMGGAVSLNAILHDAPVPACWYGVKPAISLTEMDGVPGARRFIAAAFGGPPPADRDPVRNIDLLPDDIRYRVVASPQDDQVRLDDNGGALISKLDDRGVDVSYKLVVGPHDDPTHFDPVDLSAFAEACLGGGNISNDALNPADLPTEETDAREAEANQAG